VWALLTLNFLYSTITFLSDAPLAQLDRALDFGSSGRGFESLRARHFSINSVSVIEKMAKLWLSAWTALDMVVPCLTVHR
jgi:hypothetical protein